MSGMWPTGLISSRAGAQWRTHAGIEDKEQQAWDIETYNQWMEDVKADEAREESGLAVSILHPSTVTTRFLTRNTYL